MDNSLISETQKTTTKNTPNAQNQSDQSHSKPNNFQISKFFQEFNIFNQFCVFLTTKQLFTLQQVSKPIRALALQYLREVLLKHNLIQYQKEYDVEEVNKTFKFFYKREVLYSIVKTNISKEKLEDLKVVRCKNQQILSGKGIKKFSIGLLFCAFLTHEQELFVCTNSEFFNNTKKCNYLRRENVSKFTTEPKNFMYLQSGVIKIIYFHEEKDICELSESIIEWTTIFPVQYFKANYKFAMIVLKSGVPCCQNFDLFVQSQKLSQEVQEINGHDDKTLQIAILHLNQFENEPETEKFSLKKIVNYPDRTYNSFCIGSTSAYIVDAKGLTFQVDLTDFEKVGGLTPYQVEATPFEFLKKKSITHVFSGFQFYFAIERQSIKAISDWTCEEVLEWLQSIGMEDYCKVTFAQQCNGGAFRNLTKQFMRDTLGMMDENLSQKLIHEASKYEKVTYKPQNVFSWGKNDQSQCGFPPCKNIGHPSRIQYPLLDSDDQIINIKCSWQKSILITKNKRLFVNNQQYRSRKPTQDQPTEEEKEEKPSQKGHHKKQSQKQKNPIPQKSTTEPVEEVQRWIEITSHFSQLKDKRRYELIEVSCSKELISVLAVENSGALDEQQQHKKKFTTALQLIDRIKWDEKLKREDFTIIYEDRFLKACAISFEDYLNSDIKSHRILQFKQNKAVVWDREKKFEQLQF